MTILSSQNSLNTFIYIEPGHEEAPREIFIYKSKYLYKNIYLFQLLIVAQKTFADSFFLHGF